MLSTNTAPRQLAHRVSGAIEVALFWSDETGQLTVFVSDEGTGERFEIEAAPDNALDVFQHPFAYAPHPMPVEIPWVAEEDARAA
jgi:hypothetical protein